MYVCMYVCVYVCVCVCVCACMYVCMYVTSKGTASVEISLLQFKATLSINIEQWIVMVWRTWETSANLFLQNAFGQLLEGLFLAVYPC
jgi:hypothetical protein